MNDTSQQPAHVPLRDPRSAHIERVGRDAEGLAEVCVVPAAARPRTVGPGRKERAYIERIAEAERELETARLLERGSNRLLDRLEREAEAARRLERRLSFALGALQAQNLALQAKVRELSAEADGSSAAPRLRR
ncbi:MAG: hypothetical protein H6831_07500 [Planctomycetes bacterium]|nr:hypothetical protein [Planctomycetota bacterium]MCB9904235.1 hypothetical protein [Planctomycetota bacterium]